MANPARVEVQRSLYGSIGVLTGRRAIRHPCRHEGSFPMRSEATRVGADNVDRALKLRIALPQREVMLR